MIPSRLRLRKLAFEAGIPYRQMRGLTANPQVSWRLINVLQINRRKGKKVLEVKRECSRCRCRKSEEGSAHCTRCLRYYVDRYRPHRKLNGKGRPAKHEGRRA